MTRAAVCPPASVQAAPVEAASVPIAPALLPSGGDDKLDRSDHTGLMAMGLTR